MHHPDSDGHRDRNGLFNAFGDLSKAMLGTSRWVTSVNGEHFSDRFPIRSCSVTKHDTDEDYEDDADDNADEADDEEDDEGDDDGEDAGDDDDDDDDKGDAT